MQIPDPLSHADAAPIVYSGPKLVTQVMGVGCLALVAFFTWMLVTGYDEPRTEEPAIGVVLITLAIAFVVFALGLLLVFGRRIVAFDREAGVVIKRFEWFSFHTQHEYRLEDFAAVGIGVCRVNQRPHYFVRLIGPMELWVPGGGDYDTASDQATEISINTGLDVMAEPQGVSFFPVFG